MSDKEWLLNAAAIKVARQCIKIVDEELGVRLTLSHPDFLNLLEEYSQLTDSSRLITSVRELSNYASPADVVVENQNVVSIGGRIAPRAILTSSTNKDSNKASNKANKNHPNLGLVNGKQAPINSASFSAKSSSELNASPLERRIQSPERRNDVVPYHGKNYRRWNEGKEFQGLYRGRPRYA